MPIDVLEVNRLRTNTDTANVRANVSTLTCYSSNVNRSLFYSRTSVSNNANSYDTYFPAAPTGGTVLCIGCMRVGTDTLLRCGVCCAWTVPAGVTVAKFELWGAGAGTLPGCCCSIQPFGMTGAYATICMPVTAGTIYTVCAGSASTCCPTQGGTPVVGTGSYVTGTNLCNFCAAAGSPCLPYNIISRNLFPHSSYMWFCGVYMPLITCRSAYSGHYCGFGQSADTCGIYICSYGESCFFSSTTTNAVIPSMPDTYYHCCYSGYFCNPSTGEYRRAVGVPSRSSEFCFSGGTSCGYVKHPPIPGFANTSQCCVSWSSTLSTFGGLICSPGCCQNYLTAPGSGGSMVYTTGGCNSNIGDPGRGGMVRITYC